jgi:hypothetical protein
MLQFAAPIASQAAGGEWIEICSEFGIVEIQVDTGGSPDNATQPGCPECTLCASCTTGLATPQVSQAICFKTFTLRWTPGTDGSVTPNPAQFWPDNRGPPREKTNEVYHIGRKALMSIQWKGEAS